MQPHFRVTLLATYGTRRTATLNGVWWLLPTKKTGAQVTLRNVYSGIETRLMSQLLADLLADGTMALECVALGWKTHGRRPNRLHMVDL